MLRLKKGEFLNLKIKKNNVGFRRYAVVIPKTVEKSAVRRNKLKRAIYRLVGTIRKDSSEDIVIIVKKMLPQKEEKDSKGTRNMALLIPKILAELAKLIS
jgi:ribonuclease P protein component